MNKTEAVTEAERLLALMNREASLGARSAHEHRLSAVLRVIGAVRVAWSGGRPIVHVRGT